MAASLTEREHAELLNQVREMLVWRKWSTEQVSENETQVAESLESLRISNKIVSTVYDVPEKLNLCRRGETIYTSRWGKGKVVAFRPATEENGASDAPKGTFEQRAAMEAKRLQEEKEEEERIAEEEKIEHEKNDPDFLFKWQCQFCGRKNGRPDERCKGEEMWSFFLFGITQVFVFLCSLCSRSMFLYNVFTMFLQWYPMFLRFFPFRRMLNEKASAIKNRGGKMVGGSKEKKRGRGESESRGRGKGETGKGGGGESAGR